MFGSHVVEIIIIKKLSPFYSQWTSALLTLFQLWLDLQDSNQSLMLRSDGLVGNGFPASDDAEIIASYKNRVDLSTPIV